MSNSAKGSFIEHLEALRSVLLKTAVCFLLLCIPAGYYSSDILQWLLDYAAPEGFKLHYFTVMEPFMTLLKITLVLALTGTFLPAVWWLWGFIAPGVTPEERKRLALPVSFMFFLALGGAAVAVFCIVPALIRFSLSFAGNDLQPVIGIGDFISLLLVVILASMAMFQFPVILLGLLTTGVLNLDVVKAKRPHIIVVIFVLAAIFSPPDVFSQLLLAIPTYILFEVSLLYYTIRQKKEDSYETIYKDSDK